MWTISSPSKRHRFVPPPKPSGFPKTDNNNSNKNSSIVCFQIVKLRIQILPRSMMRSLSRRGWWDGTEIVLNLPNSWKETWHLGVGPLDSHDEPQGWITAKNRFKSTFHYGFDGLKYFAPQFLFQPPPNHRGIYHHYLGKYEIWISSV